jgi:transcriptional regulator with XRE-family HTH domain
MAKAQHSRRYRQLPGLLRKLREGASLSQRWLAKKLGMTHIWVHKSETGERRVDIAEFMDWCLACGVDPIEALRTLRQSRGV